MVQSLPNRNIRVNSQTKKKEGISIMDKSDEQTPISYEEAHEFCKTCKCRDGDICIHWKADGARYGHKGTCPYGNMLVQTIIDIVES